MVKYRLLKARRAGTRFLWSRVAATLVVVAKQFDRWADTQRQASMLAFHNEHLRVGQARVAEAVKAHEAAALRAEALRAAARDAGDALLQDAKTNMHAAVAFLYDSKL
jgi:hypothetical protein